MTEKNVNYTPEMEARAIEVYDPNADQETRDAQVDALSNEFNRTRRSVISKLSRLGVYKAKEYQTKKGDRPVSKAALVANIASICGVDEDTVGSLEKATKNALNVVVNNLRTDS